jgi:acetyl-CoA C-acetyltransferase
LLWSEGLGFCPKGEGGKWAQKNFSERSLGGRLNPSGGVLAGNPLGVAGGVRVVEAVTQLKEEAGDRQVDGAATALAHGFTGACGQSHCVIVLSK